MTDLIADAQDAAQQMVSAALHGDRDLAVEIAQEAADPLVLSLVLTDLVAYVHDRWRKALGLSLDERAESWSALMADVEEWRTARTDQ